MFARQISNGAARSQSQTIHVHAGPEENIMMSDTTQQFVRVGKSAIHGEGLFALKNFSKGDRVYSFAKGRVVARDDIKNLSEREKMHLDKIGADTYEIIEPPGCYINHSCTPNVEEKNRTGYALRDITEGEEITIDYDKITFFEQPLECHCGSISCRGIVRGKR